MNIKGKVKKDQKTKELVKRLSINDIAVINHCDLDEIAALALIKAKPKAIINTGVSITGKYPNWGPLKIIEAGILLVEGLSTYFFSLVEDGKDIEIEDNVIKYENYEFRGVVLNKKSVLKKINDSQENYEKELTSFVNNTLEYAAKEIDIITNKYQFPNLKTEIKKQQVLIVVRGQNYEEDLKTIKPYIKEVGPILIGVDGGADALIEHGYKPHIIIGDMDSVSDETLLCGAELIVHAYSNGTAPGLERLENLGLCAHVLPIPGTSEDIAMLLAYEKGADLIVAVGTHSNVIDFLNKGRKGMSSTFLVRLKVGSILVDAKGVSKLYHGKVKLRDMLKIVFAALIPLIIIIVVSPTTYQLVRLVAIRFKLLFSF
ncbi:putative cytokinetic ring protein SteA [Bacillota bacterium LX-D]|nr:putative cytokinetic ring protein SteA [Bacillota bacterium LX-D]